MTEISSYSAIEIGIECWDKIQDSEKNQTRFLNYFFYPEIGIKSILKKVFVSYANYVYGVNLQFNYDCCHA